MKCAHDFTRVVGRDRPYMGPVAISPYTDENPAAHGGICYTEQCEHCSGWRLVNQNGFHVEFSPWSSVEDLRLRAERLKAAWMRERMKNTTFDSARIWHLEHGEFRVKILPDGTIEAYGDSAVHVDEIVCTIYRLLPLLFEKAKKIRMAYIEYEDAADKLKSNEEGGVLNVG